LGGTSSIRLEARKLKASTKESGFTGLPSPSRDRDGIGRRDGIKEVLSKAGKGKVLLMKNV
jgi:hypothetical protein